MNIACVLVTNTTVFTDSIFLPNETSSKSISQTSDDIGDIRDAHLFLVNMYISDPNVVFYLMHQSYVWNVTIIYNVCNITRNYVEGVCSQSHSPMYIVRGVGM